MDKDGAEFEKYFDKMKNARVNAKIKREERIAEEQGNKPKLLNDYKYSSENSPVPSPRSYRKKPNLNYSGLSPRANNQRSGFSYPHRSSVRDESGMQLHTIGENNKNEISPSYFKQNQDSISLI